MLKVSNILCVFRFIVWLLNKSAESNKKNYEASNEIITKLIVKREEFMTEIGKAEAAARKLKEFI